MILIDFSQTFNVSNPMYGGAAHTLESCRHNTINMLMRFIGRFKKDHNEIVICCDSNNYWRRELFPYYKYNRIDPTKKTQEKLDYEKRMTDYKRVIRDELIDVFPHKVINLNRAEADDIIGTLTYRFRDAIPILILSSDKDFVQLLNKNVKQYSFIAKRYLDEYQPKLYLREQIIRGDAGDGIPNILSPADSFYTGTRQIPITKKFINECIRTKNHENFCTTDAIKERFILNRNLIDLRYIPTDIVDNIIISYNESKGKSANVFRNYLNSHGLNQLTLNVGDIIL